MAGHSGLEDHRQLFMAEPEATVIASFGNDHSQTALTDPWCTAGRLSCTQHPKRKQHIFRILSQAALLQAPPSSGIPVTAEEHHSFYFLAGIPGKG